ncbi:MAG: protease modulator HflK [Clostridia bacterium]|nr:protease modulator HflK [Clostridia bacterium]
MSRNRLKSILMLLLFTGCVIAFSGVLFFMYGQSRYTAFLLCGIFLLLLGTVNLILIVFKSDIPIRERTIQIQSGFWKKIWQGIRNVPYYLGCFYNKCRGWLQLILMGGALTGAIIWMNWAFQRASKTYRLQYWHLVLAAALFVLVIVVDKYIKYLKQEQDFEQAILHNCRAFLNVAKLLIGVQAIVMSVKMLGLYDLTNILNIIILVFFYYIAVMIVLSVAVRAIRKELSMTPGIVILLPFFKSDMKDLSVISFLEENTGITLRSLWSLKFIRQMLPVAFFAGLLIFWLSTGVVYVNSNQEAAVYRFGKLQEDILTPGLHFTLPYPIEKTEIYDTDTIRKVTIGYKSDEDVDNIWTAGHGDNEYKLLLGSGNELVSINLRVEYRIADLKTYLQNSAAPEKVLEAKAYELATKRTMDQDLSTLLSVDREAFASSFKNELSNLVEEANTGLEVMNIVMESIHPPVEVAAVYQRLIGAQAEAEQIILEAQGSAIDSVFRAESYAQITIDSAMIAYHQKIAEANAALAEFMAAVEAYSEYPNAYIYQKYINAMCSTYAGTKLILVGDHVDSSRIKIFYGSLS